MAALRTRFAVGQSNRHVLTGLIAFQTRFGTQPETVDRRVLEAFIATRMADLGAQCAVFLQEFRLLSDESRCEVAHVRASPKRNGATDKFRKLTAA